MCGRGRRAVKVGVVRRTEGDKKLVQQKRRSPKSQLSFSFLVGNY